MLVSIQWIGFSKKSAFILHVQILLFQPHTITLAFVSDYINALYTYLNCKYVSSSFSKKDFVGKLPGVFDDVDDDDDDDDDDDELLLWYSWPTKGI